MGIWYKFEVSSVCCLLVVLLLFALSKSLECRMCDWELDCSSQRNLGLEHDGQRDERGTVMLVIAALLPCTVC